MNIPLLCPTCGKQYTRETPYNKHKLLCQILNGSSNQSLQLQTLEELVKSNNKLKVEVAELKKQSKVQKKKIPLLELLEKNYKPTKNYYELLDIIITSDNLENIFQSNIVSALPEIIQNRCSIEDICPLQAFDSRENILYGYSDSKWEEITKNNFDQIIFKIIKSAIIEFKNWENLHKNELHTDNFSQIYFKNISKIMVGNLSNREICRKIYNGLYKLLKKPITNIEYSIS